MKKSLLKNILILTIEVINISIDFINIKGSIIAYASSL